MPLSNLQHSRFLRHILFYGPSSLLLIYTQTKRPTALYAAKAVKKGILEIWDTYFLLPPRKAWTKKSLNKTCDGAMYSDPRVVTIEHTRKMPLLYNSIYFCYAFFSRTLLSWCTIFAIKIGLSLIISKLKKIC